MPQPGPYTKTELATRLRFVRDGLWNDRILVFLDREVWVHQATVEGDQVRLVGVEQETVGGERRHVNELVDPRDVTRVV